MEKSFNKEVKGTNGLTLGDVLTDSTDQEEACVEKIYYQDILKKLDEVMPEARKIGLMRLEGKSDRQIADELGINRMTMVRMLARIKAELKIEL